MLFAASIVAAALVMQAPASSAEPRHGTYEDHGTKRQIRFRCSPGGSRIPSADLHTHSVFSDGHVWRSVRLEEAHRDGLHAIALTELLEHQPRRRTSAQPCC